MLEYVLFNAETCARFCAFLVDRGLKPETRPGDPGVVVCLAEDSVDDALADAFYDEIFALEQQIFDGNADPASDNYHAAGVVVNLKDGRAVYAEVSPALLNKVMQALDPRELGELVTAVVDAVENPDQRTFCQRMRDADA